MSSEQSTIPERPKDQPEAGAQAASADAQDAPTDKGPSKKELKKLEKEREKAAKAAQRAAEDQKKKEEAEASDTAKHLYGKLNNGLAEEGSPVPQDLKDLKEGELATIRARVHNARGQSAKLAFLDLRQRTENIQAVIAEGGDNGISRLMIKWVTNLSRESIVLVTGLVKTPKEPIQSATISNLELHIEKIYMVVEGPSSLPMQVRDAMHPPPISDEVKEGEVDESGAPLVSLYTRLNNRVLDLRTPLNQGIFAINSLITELYREYMVKNRFVELQTPKIAGEATEGGSSVFEIKYFNSQAYLTQSPQFYKQMAISSDMGRVFETGAVYRAENSNTPRHLTEFTGLDFEMEIRSNWTEVIDTAEECLQYVFQGLRTRGAYWMSVIQREYPDAGNFKIPEGKAPRLTFQEGIKMLKDAGVTDASEDEDVSTTQEKTLGKLVYEKYGTDFYFMTGYPASARPSYTHPDPENPKFSRSYDAFMRGQEIMSGAQRVHDPEMLVTRMKALGQDPSSDGFRHYIDAFRFGCAPHGGGGMGLNRITMLWLGLPNVRQATLFPRDPSRKIP